LREKYIIPNFAAEKFKLLFNHQKYKLMKTKKTAAAQQAATTATETKNRSSKNSSRTVKNNQKSEERKAAEAATAADLQARNEENARRDLWEQKKAEAEAEQAAAEAEKKAVKAGFQEAKREVKNATNSALFVFHHLNRFGKSGKCTEAGVNMVALKWCYEAITAADAAEEKRTGTAAGRKGFSFDVVKTNSRQQICKMVEYKAATGDEESRRPDGAKLMITRRFPDGVEYIDTFAGRFLLIPVKVDFIGILDAVKSYVDYYTTVQNDLRSYVTKSIRPEMEAAAAKAAAEKAEKKAKRAEKKAAKAAAQQQQEQPTPEAVTVQMEATKKAGIFSHLRRIAALF